MSKSGFMDIQAAFFIQVDEQRMLTIQTQHGQVFFEANDAMLEEMIKLFKQELRGNPCKLLTQ